MVGSTPSHPGAAGAQSYTALTAMGSPASPTAWNGQSNGQWDVISEARDLDAAATAAVPRFSAGHASDCSNTDTAPFPSHPVSNRADQLFVCHDHLMTSLDSDQYGYGAAFLAPPAMVNFSQGAAIDLASTTFRTSDRDWWDLWVTPFSENFVVPLDQEFPDLNGPPKDSVHIKMDQFNGGTIFTGDVYNNFKSTDLKGAGGASLLESFVPPSVVNRGDFELRLTPVGGRYRIQFGLVKSDVGSPVAWFVDDTVSLPFSQGVFQLGLHSYTPTKDAGCGPTIEDVQKGLGCAANTWHWSDFSINNAVPFTIDPGNPWAAGDAATARVTLSQPSPANSFLRFGARAGNLQVSFDGGRSWSAAQVRRQVGGGLPNPAVDAYHLQNFWMPMPAGVRDVEFKGQGGWWGSSWFVQDVSAWSETAPATAPKPTPGATPVPSPPPTSAPTPAPSPSASPNQRRRRHGGGGGGGGSHWWFKIGPITFPNTFPWSSP
jgi:hypothetical protein